MNGVSDNDLIYAAFILGAEIERASLLQGILGQFKLKLTPDMIERLKGFEPGVTMFGYDKFAPITDLGVPNEIVARFLAARKPIYIIPQLTRVSERDLAEQYGLTEEEIAMVKAKFDSGVWRLRSDPPTD